MDPFFQRQLDDISKRGEEASRLNAEREVHMSQGQTPTVDANIYNPKDLKDAGYPLSNPTEQPNKYTKEGAMVYAGRDASNSQPINPVTPVPEVQGLATNMYKHRSGRAFSLLDNASNTFEIDAATNHIFKGIIQYERAAQDEFGNLEEANQMRWATSDRLEESGFNILHEAVRGPEGIDDRGLMGLQAVYASHILRGSKDLSSVMNKVGDTGATEEQNIAAWNSAAMQWQNARYGTALDIPASKEEQLEDKRYLGASAIVMTALAEAWGGSISPEQIKSASPEDLYGWGMTNIDAIKSNTVALGMLVKAGKESNLPVGEAINYLFSVEDQLPTTMGDFGRGLGGVLTDPISYIGGASLIAKGMAKVAGQNLVKQALRKAGLMGAEGAAFAGGHEAILDWGQQELDIMALEQEGYDPGRGAVAGGQGALFGFVFGGVLGGLSKEGRTVIKNIWQSVRAKNDPHLKGLHPDGAGGYTPLTPEEQVTERAFNIKMQELDSLSVKERDKVLDTYSPEELAKVQDWIDHDRALNPGPGQSSGAMGYVSAAGEFADVPIPGNVIPEAELRVRRQLRQFMEEDKLRKMADDEELQKEFIGLANEAAELEKKRLTLVKGGKAADAPDDPTHMAPMELVRNEQLIADQADADVLLAKIEKHSLDTPEGLEKYRSEFYTKVQQRMLEANDIVQEHIDAGDFRFKIDDTVVSKHSGKEFKIHHLKWDIKGKKKGEPQYFVTGPDGEKHYMSEWGMVGGKPKLELVNGVPLEDFPE